MGRQPSLKQTETGTLFAIIAIAVILLVIAWPFT
jgi:hypothetical protein